MCYHSCNEVKCFYTTEYHIKCASYIPYNELCQVLHCTVVDYYYYYYNQSIMYASCMCLLTSPFKIQIY